MFICTLSQKHSSVFWNFLTTTKDAALLRIVVLSVLNQHYCKGWTGPCLLARLVCSTHKQGVTKRSPRLMLTAIIPLEVCAVHNTKPLGWQWSGEVCLVVSSCAFTGWLVFNHSSSDLEPWAADTEELRSKPWVWLQISYLHGLRLDI